MKPRICAKNNPRNYRQRYWLAFFIVAIFPSTLEAQVANNNITNRSSLLLNEDPTSSTTNYATVEWKCISKALTNKCLTYHNDQWFAFTVPEPGRYYLNLATDSCLNKYGIQAIVIEGNPCELSTYKILRCIPKILYDEAFIELDSLKSGLAYLVNIDGFLGDFCNFNIQLSTSPVGLPQEGKSLNNLGLSALTEGKVVTLKWTIPEDYTDLRAFDVYRSKKRKAPVLTDRVTVELNSVGLVKREYSTTDTLTMEDTYTYQIMGIFRSGRVDILDEHVIPFYHKIVSKKRKTLDLALGYKNKTLLQLLVLDKYNDRVLTQTTFRFNNERDGYQQVDVERFVNDGVRTFIVRVVDLKHRTRRDYEFVVNDEGSISRK